MNGRETLRRRMAPMTTSPNDADRARVDDFLHEDLTRRIIGCYYAVGRKLGPGYLESVYKRALGIELARAKCSCAFEAPLDVFYDGIGVGRFFADLIVENAVIVELKASSALVEADKKQLINCLSCTNIEVGLLFQFGAKRTFERVVFSNQNKEMLRQHS